MKSQRLLAIFVFPAPPLEAADEAGPASKMPQERCTQADGAEPPLAFALRHTAFYRRGVLVGGSILIAAIAAVWLAERVFNFKALPF